MFPVQKEVRKAALKLFDGNGDLPAPVFRRRIFPAAVRGCKGGAMRISVRGMTIAFALLWGGGVGMVALLHLADPGYGTAFLDAVRSIYPGFHGATSLNDAFAGIVYALVDGAIGGCILALLYNLFAGHPRRQPAEQERVTPAPTEKAA